MAQNTVYNLNADKIAQTTGSGAPLLVQPTYASTISIDASQYSYWDIVTTAAVGNATITCSNPGNPGNQVSIQIDNDASGARTITFGTGFRSTGTVTGTTSKSILVTFVSNGTSLLEDGRSSAAV